MAATEIDRAIDCTMALRLIKVPPPKATLKSRLPWQGNKHAAVMVVVDPVIVPGGQEPTDVATPMSRKLLNQLAPYMKEAGLKGEDLVLISACRPITEDVWKSESKLNKVLKADNELFRECFASLRPKLIIAQGKAAIRQVINKPAKITKLRGVAFKHDEFDTLVMPTLGIGHVARVPEHGELFTADLLTAARIIKRNFKLEEDHAKKNYKWVYDLGFMLGPNKPKIVSVDSEYTSYGASDFAHWYLPQTRVLTVQLTTKAGEGYIVPIDYKRGYVKNNPIQRARLVRQLKQLLEDPEIEVVGQNFKSDCLILLRKLGIRVANWKDDVMLLAHMLNENMLSKALDDIARVYLPHMAGYKDEFKRKGYDYTRMDLVDPDDMCEYGGGDSDAVFQLRDILLKKIKADPKLYNCYRLVVMPALHAFIDIEQEGFKVNRKALEALRQKVAAKQKKEYAKLIAMIPKEIIDEFEHTGVGLKLTRDVLLRAYLFTHPRGLKFKARQFTKGTKAPSVSSKTHLPYFIGHHPFIHSQTKDKDGKVIAEHGIIAYIKNDKMLTTYIGEDRRDDQDPTGFWKYIFEDFIRPSYHLHRTVTGRTNSTDPNGQNFPKRGEFAKEYRAIFEAQDGWTLLEADYSQLELRIAGIMANEPTFLKIYREGGDIHCMTAAIVMGISLEAFMRLKETDPEKFNLGRFRAKAVNFGFIYGMGWRKFMVYAKTEYGIDYTEEEAQRIRAAFFSKYRALEAWHETTKDFVRQHHYVRCFDGRVRHLPAVVVDDDGVRSSAERQAINSPVQGFGSDLGLMALARINRELPKDLVRVIGFVHDAIICIAKEGREMEAARAVKKYMESNPLEKWFGFKSPIPIVAEVSLGKNLAKMTEIKDTWLKDEKIKSFVQVTALKAANDMTKLKPKLGPRVVKLPPRKAA